MKRFWDVIGEILAVVYVVVFAFLIINANFTLVDNADVLTVLNSIREWGALAIVAVVGFEAIARRNFIFKLIFIILIALIVIFLFFPGTYENLIGAFKAA